MDDRSTNALRQLDPFAATDALLSGGLPAESLFVINLCAANMPQAIDASSVRAWGIAGLESYKLYQVSRMEDGRTRYRVRLGFFTSEADAESVLKSVRGKFASAFTSGLCDEDLKHACGHLKKPLNEIREIQDIQRTGRYRIPNFKPEELSAINATGRHAMPKAAPPAPVPASISRAANAMLAVSAAAPVHKPIANSHDELVEIEWSPTERPAEKSAVTAKVKDKPVAATNENKSVKDKWAAFAQSARSGESGKQPSGKSVSKNVLPAETKPKQAAQPTMTQKAQQKPAAKPAHLELAPAMPLSKNSAAAAPTTPSKAPFHVASGRTILDHGLELQREDAAPPKTATPMPPRPSMLPRPLVSADALAKLRAAAAQPRNASAAIPTLDTTQTIRTLTKTEIEDANAPKWFVVQLAISDQPANLETMPRLDIFEAYRLYSVAVMQNNIIKHALRLGFFSEKVSAEAVMGYVKTFFGEPLIEQISDAEQKRFNDELPLSDSAGAEATKPQSPQGRVITLEEKRPTHPLTIAPSGVLVAAQPTSGSPYKTASKSSAPVKRSAPVVPKRSLPTRGAPGKTTTVSRKQINEARMLGLSDTAIQRVERNPSLLSRLVGKLTK